MKPLSGIRVLDLSRALAGPHCAQLLGDLGAEVIKLENPASPDEIRGWPPFSDEPNSVSTYFLSANRNKNFMWLELASPEAIDQLHELIDGFDVVVENFRPDVAARFRLDPETFRAAHPDVVLGTIAGFSEGELQGSPAYDASIQAMTGLMALTGPSDGEVARIGVAVVDLSAGLYAALGIVAALVDRGRSGTGAHVLSSLFDAASVTAGFPLMAWSMSGEQITRSGTRHPAMTPNKVFETATGPILVMAGKEAQWLALCDVLGRSDLPADPRYVSNASRVGHQNDLYVELDSAFLPLDRAQIAERLFERGVPTAPVRSVSEAYAYLVEQESSLLQEMTDAHGVTRRVVGNPLLFNGERLNGRFGEMSVGTGSSAAKTRTD